LRDQGQAAEDPKKAPAPAFESLAAEAEAKKRAPARRGSTQRPARPLGDPTDTIIGQTCKFLVKFPDGLARDETGSPSPEIEP